MNKRILIRALLEELCAAWDCQERAEDAVIASGDQIDELRKQLMNLRTELESEGAETGVVEKKLHAEACRSVAANRRAEEYRALIRRVRQLVLQAGGKNIVKSIDNELDRIAAIVHDQGYKNG